MTRIVDELHSSCLARGLCPDPGKKLRKRTDLQERLQQRSGDPQRQRSENRRHRRVRAPDRLEPVGQDADRLHVQEHERRRQRIQISGNHEQPFRTQHPPTGCCSPATSPRPKNQQKRKIPIFQYYKYDEESTSSSTTPDGTLESLNLNTFPSKRKKNRPPGRKRKQRQPGGLRPGQLQGRRPSTAKSNTTSTSTSATRSRSRSAPRTRKPRSKTRHANEAIPPHAPRAVARARSRTA